jgi:hypothetical protein
MIRKDISGQKFGMLTVIKWAHGGQNSYWLCKCSCGNETTVPMPNLKSGNTTHCGCVPVQNTSFIDRTGQQYGRLTVISNINKCSSRTTRTNWLCRCSCGEILSVESGNLASGHTQSCGCYFIEQVSTHGCCAENRRLYSIWGGMMARCFNPNSKGYRFYGARGRTVCEEWKDVRTFFEWALSNGYTDELTIERKNPTGNYESSNCEWIALKFQMQNTTVSLGKFKVLEIRNLLSEGFKPKEIAEEFGVAYTTIISIKNFDNYKELRP